MANSRRSRDASKTKIEVETYPDYQIIRQPNPLYGAVKRISEQGHDDPVARAEQALNELSGEFEGWMQEECSRLALAHAAIIKQGFNAETQAELFRAAHDIKGDAATFGYPIAAAAAESLCRILEHAPDVAKVPGDLIAHHVNAIQAIVREHRRFGVDSVAGELSRKLRGVADEFLAAVNKDRPDHLEVILAPSIIPAE
jgi:HPt (histidine-containing phosphotransfer) domain-containing protein